MAYLNRTIRLAFDGTDEKLPALGDDIFVTIANPLLMPASKLQPKVTIEANPDGTPKDPQAALDATYDIIAGIVIDWCVYDPSDFSENPEKLSLPATMELMQKLPTSIIGAISEILGKALNPQ